MGRIRSIKPEFWTSESLGTRLQGPDGRQARLLFVALWNHAEDHGVCRASPILLRASTFAYDEDVTTADVARWLGLLEAGGFIVRYERGGSSYLWIRSFDEHQRIDRKSKTTLPEPSADEVERRAIPRRVAQQHIEASSEPSRSTGEQENKTDFPDSSPRRALVEPSLQEGKGGERRGEEEEHFAATADAAPLASGQDVLFEQPKPTATKTEKPKKPKPEPASDPRHAPLVKALCEPEFRYAFRGGHDAKAVSDLLRLADSIPWTSGDAAPAEIIRRWRICRGWVGFPSSPHLAAFATNWNAYADPQSTSNKSPVRAETQPQYDPNKPAVTVLKGADAFKEWCP